MERFDLYTLVDITKTNARRGEDKLAYGQQQNYMSMMQTLGLRTNVEVSNPTFKKQKATYTLKYTSSGELLNWLACQTRTLGRPIWDSNSASRSKLLALFYAVHRQTMHHRY